MEMEIVLTNSSGSPSTDRDLLISTGLRGSPDQMLWDERGILLRATRSRLVFLAAENRYFYDLDEDCGEDPQWAWRFPLRVLYRLDWADVLPDFGGTYALSGGKAYGCDLEESFAGPFLVDTSPLAYWQWMYDDLDRIVKRIARRPTKTMLSRYPTSRDLRRHLQLE